MNTPLLNHIEDEIRPLQQARDHLENQLANHYYEGEYLELAYDRLQEIVDDLNNAWNQFYQLQQEIGEENEQRNHYCI